MPIIIKQVIMSILVVFEFLFFSFLIRFYNHEGQSRITAKLSNKLWISHAIHPIWD